MGIDKKIQLCPISQKEAKVFIDQHHRHLRASIGSVFQIAIMESDRIVGVVMVGRPVARFADDGWTLEVNRCCVLDGVKNGCSKLYAAAWRAAKALGYRRLITYTLQNEPGTSLIATGFVEIGRTKGGSWNCKSRPRVDLHPLQCKIRWALEL